MLVYSSNLDLVNQVPNGIFQDTMKHAKAVQEFGEDELNDLRCDRKYLSDIEGLSIEWDGPYGKYWLSYGSAEALRAALDEHSKWEDKYKAGLKLNDESYRLWSEMDDHNWMQDQRGWYEEEELIESNLLEKFNEEAFELEMNLIAA